MSGGDGARGDGVAVWDVSLLDRLPTQAVGVAETVDVVVREDEEALDLADAQVGTRATTWAFEIPSAKFVMLKLPKSVMLVGWVQLVASGMTDEASVTELVVLADAVVVNDCVDVGDVVKVPSVVEPYV